MIDGELANVGVGLQHLRPLLRQGAPCPQCKSDKVIYREPISDYPGLNTHMLMLLCPRCSLAVQWEVRTDDAGNSSVVVIDVVNLKLQ